MVGGFNQIQRENEAVKNRVTRDIRNLFEHKEDGNYYKPGERVIFGVRFILNMKVTVIQIKHF